MNENDNIFNKKDDELNSVEEKLTKPQDMTGINNNQNISPISKHQTNSNSLRNIINTNNIVSTTPGVNKNKKKRSGVISLPSKISGLKNRANQKNSDSIDESKNENDNIEELNEPKKKKGIGTRISNNGRNISKAGTTLSKAGDRLQKATKGKLGSGLSKLGNSAQKKGKEVEEKGNKVSSVGQKVSEKLNVFEILKKRIKKRVIKIAIFICSFLMIFAIITGSIGQLIDEALTFLDNAATGTANVQEKLDNFYNGLGFQNTQAAFLEELEYLDTKYDHKLNIPLLLSTVFYDDINSIADNSDPSISDDLDDAISFAAAAKWLGSKIKESNVTVGNDGFNYTSNKIYRLRLLAKNQFNTTLFGTVATTSTTEEMGLSEYLKQCKEQIGSEVYQFLESFVVDVISFINPLNSKFMKTDAFEDFYNVLFKGEKIYTTDLWNKFIADGSIAHFIGILKTFFSSFTDIVGVKTFISDVFDSLKKLDLADAVKAAIGKSSCGELICVEYKTYEYSEDNYKNYLRKKYIRTMPEFKKFINSSDEKVLDKEIENIIDEIFEFSEAYSEFFEVNDSTSENYEETICLGNIKESLLQDLRKPVDIKDDFEVDFSGKYSFGISGGKMHNGLDLNAKTAGVNEGDSVYSIGLGKVLESTNDKTYSDDKVKGGWLKIQYSSTSGTENYSYYAIYGGLNATSVKLKKGDIVTKGQVLGTIGSKDVSEDGVYPSLHFGFYDLLNKRYLDPTNLFISCEEQGGGGITCKTFLMHDTHSISESKFIKDVNTYCSNNTCNSQINSWNLSAVYKKSVSENLNPKFTVIRAMIEGFSPGGDTYNYWGIGCWTGHACSSYQNLQAGITGLANLSIVKERKTLFDTMQSYAPFPMVWENPGSSSRGGCYYQPYMEEFMSESDKNHSKAACKEGVSGVETTQGERDAYTEYQCAKSIELNKAIFGASEPRKPRGSQSSTPSNTTSGTTGVLQSPFDTDGSVTKLEQFAGNLPTSNNGSCGSSKTLFRYECDFHGGNDYPAPTGTPVYAVDGGTVIHSGTPSSGWEDLGLYVAVSNTYGGTTYTTTYQHLSSVSVQEGQTLSKGQLIGYVGNTGDSSGSHLHLEIIKGAFECKSRDSSCKNATYRVNPYEFIAGSRKGQIYFDGGNY